jgi:DNA-binding MarR family transcriptional regulator
MKTHNRLIYLLSMAQLTLKGYVNAAFLKAGAKVTLAQVGVLFLLEQKDMRIMSELGKAIQVDNSAMTHLIDRLEKNGFVERRIDPSNRRAILIHITPDGLQEEMRARKIINAINEEIVNSFTPEEIEAHEKILMGIQERFKVK